MFEKAAHAHYVIHEIAIQPGLGGDNDIIVFAVLQLLQCQRGVIARIPGFGVGKLVKMMC